MSSSFKNKPLKEHIYEIVRQIPAGKVASYGQIAMLAGKPRAAPGGGDGYEPLHRGKCALPPCGKRRRPVGALPCLYRGRGAADAAGNGGRCRVAGWFRGLVPIQVESLP